MDNLKLLTFNERAAILFPVHVIGKLLLSALLGLLFLAVHYASIGTKVFNDWSWFPSVLISVAMLCLQCCPGKVAPTDGKSLPLNVLWPVLPGNDLKSRGRKWPPERSIPTRHNGG